MTPVKLETIPPISLDTSLIEGDCLPSIVLVPVTNYVALPGVRATVMATEFKTNPRKVVIFLGSKTYFS